MKSAIECSIAGLSHRLRPPGVRSDGEVHRVVGFELFALICSPELHGIPARLYSRIDAFEIRGNSENNFSESGVDVARCTQLCDSSTRDVCFQSPSRRMDFAMDFVQ